MKRRVLATLGAVTLSSALTAPARAQEAAATNPEIERLKAQLAAQQEQIDQLAPRRWRNKKSVGRRQQAQAPSLGEVASTSADRPRGRCRAGAASGLAAALSPRSRRAEAASPLQFKIGTATITPLSGSWILPSVFRSADGGSGIGTSFGSTPYNNVSTGLGKLERIPLQRSEQPYRRPHRRLGPRHQSARLLGV